MLKLLGLLLGLSPSILAIVAGLGGAGVGGAGVWALHQFIIDPDIRRDVQREADYQCTIRTMDAANRAESAERQRQQAEADRTLKLYQDEVTAREAARVRELEALEDENALYTKLLADEGRSCPLSQSDVDRVRGESRSAAPVR